MSKVLGVPSTEHRCRIGYKYLTVTEEEVRAANPSAHLPPLIPGTFLVEDLEINRLPTGSVVECASCGQVWVKSFTGWRYHSKSAFWCHEWRKETRRERRRRHSQEGR